MSKFQLHANYSPAGDQPQAIDLLSAGLDAGLVHQTLLGATGTGKTFTMANIIENIEKPTLVLAHNKTLAAQLFSEFKEFFPENAVEYFVSYYDYYQPEAYVPQRDLYIEKDAGINEAIERYRASATQSLLTRNDVIVVASVSCIYGLGDPQDFWDLARTLKVGEEYDRNKLIRHLSDMQYERSEYEFYTGNFRVRGDVVDINIAADERAVRVEYFGDEIERIAVINPISGEVIDTPAEYAVFPAKQFVTPEDKLKAALPRIRDDLEKEIKKFKDAGKDIEAMRLKQRVNYDLEMLEETGYTKGIENYSRYIDNRPPGSPPSTLIDYFPDDYLMFIDESHITVPQVRGMYNGDKARKQNLVDYGFRLEAALDNRPLKFEEFNERSNQIVYVSATPDEEYEQNLSRQEVSKKMQQTTIADLITPATREIVPKQKLEGTYDGIAEQIIRPTGLLDPFIDVRPVQAKEFTTIQTEITDAQYSDMTLAQVDSWQDDQVPDLLKEVQKTVDSGLRVLVTTLTKRMSEELSNYLTEKDIKAKYIHSDIDAIERIEILKELRLGEYDVLVGINLLREGLDLPEVSLVAILDADKEGFLRSETSLIQTIGRAARHSQGRVILYADKITGSMQRAIDETRRRRKIQQAYNEKHGITPQTIQKEISKQFDESFQEAHKDKEQQQQEDELRKKAEGYKAMSKQEKKQFKEQLRVQMEMHSDLLEFEQAAEIRDILDGLE